MDNWVHDLGDNASTNAKPIAQERSPKMHLDEAMDKRIRDLEDKASSNAKAIAQIRKDQVEFGTQRVRLQGLLVRMTNCEAKMDNEQRIDKSDAKATVHDTADAATNGAEGHGSVNADIARIDSDIEKICADNHDLWADRQGFNIRLTDVEQRLAKLESASSSARAQQKSTNDELISILASPPRKEPNGVMPTPSSTLRDSSHAPQPKPPSSSARTQQKSAITELSTVSATPPLKELKAIMPMLSSTLRDSLHAPQPKSLSGSARTQQKSAIDELSSAFASPPPKEPKAMMPTPSSVLCDSLHARPSAQEFVPGQPWHDSGESSRKVRAVKW
jgi:uncharacterized coiled-coil protein SlyX